MVTLAILASPTFKAKVAVPVPGGAPVDVELTFTHKTKTQFNAWLASLAEKTDVDAFMEIVSGWSLEDPFNAENVAQLLEQNIGAGAVTYETYRSELVGERRKN